MNQFLFACSLFCLCVQVSAQSIGLVWAKQHRALIGAKSYGYQIEVDAVGNVYSLGRFYGAVDFDPSAAVYTLSSAGFENYMTKSDNLGNLIWAKNFSNPALTSIGNGGFSQFALDNNSNMYITGPVYRNTDFDPGVGTMTLNPTLGGSFLMKLDANGNLLWTRQFGDSSAYSKAIKVDNAGDLLVSGTFTNSGGDFDPGAGFSLLSTNGNSDVFVLKLTAAGNFVWACSYGGSSGDAVSALQIDVGNSILLTGSFSQICDFDPSPSVSTMNALLGNGYVTRLTAAGGFVGAWQLGSTTTNISQLGIDASGAIYLAANFNGTGDFDPSAATFSISAWGSTDIMICKYSSVGNFIWAKHVGGKGSEFVSSLKVDQIGNVYYSGSYRDTCDFDPGIGTYTFVAPSILNDGYVSKLDANGNFVWVKQHTSISGEHMLCIALDQSPNIYITGIGGSQTDFDPGTNVLNFPILDSDAYLEKLSNCSPPLSPTVSAASNSVCGPSSFSLSAVGAGSIAWRNLQQSNTYLGFGANYTSSVLAVGQYSFYATASNTCAESFSPTAFVVNVYPFPNISVVSTKTNVCIGESATLSASGALNYALGNTFSTGSFVVSPPSYTVYTVQGGNVYGCTSTASIQLSIDPCVGLSETSHAAGHFIVSPNPSAGILQVQASQTGIVRLFGTSVAMVYESGINKFQTLILNLDLAAGMYILVFENEEGKVRTQKVIRE